MTGAGLEQMDEKVLFETPSINRVSCVWRFIFFSIFFLFGITCLMPATTIYNVAEYLKARVKSSESLDRFFFPSVSIFSNGGNLIGSFLNLIFSHRISSSFRVILPLTTYLVCYSINLIITSQQISGSGFYAIFMISIMLMNTVVPVMVSAVYEIVGFFDPKCLSGFITGQSFGSIISSLVSVTIIALGVGKNTEKADAVAISYFSYNFCVIFVCLFVFLMMISSTIYKKCTSSEHADHNEGRTQTISLIRRFKRLFDLLFKYKIPCVSLFLNLAITLFIYPVFIMRVLPLNILTDENKDHVNLFKNLACFLSYNVGDFLGRMLFNVLPYPSGGSYLFPVYSASRILFLVLYMMCNQPVKQMIGMVFAHDCFPFILTLLFGITNGHILTIAFSYPYKSENKSDQSDLTTLLVLVLAFGLAAGSGLSFIF